MRYDDIEPDDIDDRGLGVNLALSRHREIISAAQAHAILVAQIDWYLDVNDDAVDRLRDLELACGRLALQIEEGDYDNGR